MKSYGCLSKNGIDKILSNYDLKGYQSYKFIDAKNSYIYLIKTSKSKYILKSQKDNMNTSEEIKWQKRVSDFLFKKDINCQRVVETKDNNVAVAYNNREYHLLTYIEGKVLHDKYCRKTYMSIAKNIALMQKAFSRFKENKNDYNYLNVEKFIKDGAKDYYSKSDINDFNELVKNLKSIDYSKLKKCMIHGDLSEINILQDNNKFSGFIDFAYPYIYYRVMDLAYYIANCIIQPEWIKDFFKEYNKIIKLNLEERKALYYFVRMNLMRKEHLLKDSYPIFKDVSLDDFLKYSR